MKHINIHKVNPHDLQDEDWLEPSQGVWDKIESTIQPKKKDPKLLFWLPMGIVSILLFGILFFNNRPTQYADNKTKVKENLIATSQTDEIAAIEVNATLDQINNISQNTDERLSPTLENALAKNSIPTGSNGSKAKDILSSNLYKTSNTNSPTNNYTSASLVDNSYSSNTENKNIETTLTSSAVSLNSTISKSDIAINPVAFVSMLTPKIPYLYPLTSPSLYPINDIIKPKLKNGNWYVGVNIGYSPFRMNDTINSKDPLEGTVENTYSKNNVFAQFMFQRKLNQKWSILAQPGIRVAQQYTDYDLYIPYDYNSERTLSTHKENTFSHSLPTGWNNIDTELTVARSLSSNVQHNETVHIDFISRIRSYNLQLPVGLRYQMSGFDNGLFASLLYAPQMAINTFATKDKIASLHPLVDVQSINLKYVDQQSVWNHYGTIQMGYRYAFTQRFFVEPTITYMQHLGGQSKENQTYFNLVMGCKL
jgi:hypothetical protein